MGIVVQKYGGSSVADAEGIKRVAQRILDAKRAGNDVVVVVSAMGDTTDELLTMARQVSPNPDRRELDMLLSAGERISMALLSAFSLRSPIGGFFHDAFGIQFTFSMLGVVVAQTFVAMPFYVIAVEVAYVGTRTDGGFAVLNTNDLAAGLRRISADVRDYYVIGYEPDPDTFAPEGARPHAREGRSLAGQGGGSPGATRRAAGRSP